MSGGRLHPDRDLQHSQQKSLLIPLYGPAVETGKRRPILRDPKAAEMVEAIDYDFARLDGGRSLWWRRPRSESM
ncbi:hypothetical protein [Nocardia nepalensis]|uniref:hypothetical protein n=1 Tax=Nocardia nepalensis TaxID=3375448 RepID=UPI003B66EF82